MTQLTVGRHHLAANRRMIIARSIAASMAGIVPIPLVDDWLVSRVRRGTIRRIASMRGVDLDEEALIAIADGPSSPPSWGAIAGTTLLFKALGKAWRKLIITYVAAQRARSAANTFAVSTLFDHYCASLHVGMGLDREAGIAVRKLIGETIDYTEGGLATEVFRRGIAGAARASVRAPAELLDVASGGRLRKLLTRGDETVAVAEIDDAIAHSTDDESDFLSRAVAAIESQLTAAENPYLERLLNGFESRWRRRSAPAPTSSRDPSGGDKAT